MERGGQPGNDNATKSKPWADAIKRALARKGEGDYHEGLNRLADALLDKASEGDMPALKEVGERLDGKVAQGIIGGEEGDPAIRANVVVEFIKP